MNPESPEDQRPAGSTGPLADSRFSILNFQSPIPLRAGPFTLRYEGGDLRYIRLGEREVIRRIYAAVRDHNWGTVPGVISDLRSEISSDEFHLSYTSEHRQNEIHFVWQAELAGEADGTIRFTFDGEARSSFRRNRIGCCVLHPIRECVGARCAAIYDDGSRKELAFPTLVARAQPIPGLHDLAGLAHEIEPGVWAELRFEGDLFEMEDQRNWIDASFKTFSTPLRRPFPVEIKAGTRVRQSVTLRCVNARGSSLFEREKVPVRVDAGVASDLRSSDSRPKIQTSEPLPPPSVVTLTLGQQTFPIPPIGLGLASHGQALSAVQTERLDALALAHLRVDLRLNEEGWQETLARGMREAESLGCQLELALHLSGLPNDDLKDLAESLTRSRFRSFEFMRRAQAFRRFLIFTLGAETTSVNSLKAARRFVREFGLTPGQTPVGGGTDADFYQLGQFKGTPDLVDFITFSMNPQSHAFDLTSLAETPEAVPATIESAREYFGRVPVVVSPITLKARINAVATGPEASVPPGELPASVDPRQTSLFGAGWTLAMLRRLIESRVESVTFFETAGWRGVMEVEAGSPAPEKFPSIPGGVFPLYHVFADVAEFRSGEMLAVSSSDTLVVEALVLRSGPRLTVLLANLTGVARVVELRGARGRARVRLLDEASVIRAMTEPAAFRRQAPKEEIVGNDLLRLELKPFALVRVDCTV